MPRNRKAKRTTTKSFRRGVVEMVTASINRRTAPRNRRRSITNLSPTLATNNEVYLTRGRARKAKLSGRQRERECKPTAFLDVEDSSPITSKPPRIPRAVQNNKVYVIPDSDEDDDDVIEEIQPETNLTDEKRKWIQSYINSITPNRVDYTNKPPMADIIQIKDDEPVKSPEVTEEEIQRIIQKHADSLSPCTNVIERIDYSEGKKEVRTKGEKPVASTSEIEEPVPSTSWAVNLERNEITPSTSNTGDSLVTTSRHIRDKDGKHSDSVMDFVEQIVAEQMDEISKEVEERHNRMWGQQEERMGKHNESENNCIDIDSSVEIIGTPDFLDNSMEMIDIKGEISNSKDSDVNDAKHTDKETHFKKDCPICLDPLSEAKEISATVCGHVFCTACIRAAIRQSHRCPNCRTKLTLKKIIPLFL